MISRLSAFACVCVWRVEWGGDFFTHLTLTVCFFHVFCDLWTSEVFVYLFFSSSCEALEHTRMHADCGCARASRQESLAGAGESADSSQTRQHDNITTASHAENSSNRPAQYLQMPPESERWIPSQSLQNFSRTLRVKRTVRALLTGGS